MGGPAAGAPAADSPGLGAAARALADAVAGLLGRDATGSGAGAAPGRAAAGVLADVVSAVAGAARSRGSSKAGGDRTAPVEGETTGPRSRWTPGGLLTDLLDAAAPALPIRDRQRLQQAHPGATEQEIAEALTARAARLTGAIGAATGGLAAAQWFAPPSLVAMPLELGAQTVLVAAVEVVLVGELHELYRRPAPGDARERAVAYLTSWSTQRAVGSTGSGSLFSRLGSAGAQALRRRVTRRLAGSASSLAPLLVGATLAARSNRKATASLAERLLADLRTALPRQRPPGTPD
ncbi:hypothetical protein [Modestobacter sp. DSM 44400]|uniref:hypothetical protein n=1 Tax=Modestobacter sp. DSM 44400 TaxID=1550230 RepID=UPI0020C88E98|nr:hypothetical protein [Modestobacter sp. DSM 44400]